MTFDEKLKEVRELYPGVEIEALAPNERWIVDLDEVGVHVRWIEGFGPHPKIASEDIQRTMFEVPHVHRTDPWPWLKEALSDLHAIAAIRQIELKISARLWPATGDVAVLALGPHAGDPRGWATQEALDARAEIATIRGSQPPIANRMGERMAKLEQLQQLAAEFGAAVIFPSQSQETNDLVTRWDDIVQRAKEFGEVFEPLFKRPTKIDGPVELVQGTSLNATFDEHHPLTGRALAGYLAGAPDVPVHVGERLIIELTIADGRIEIMVEED